MNVLDLFIAWEELYRSQLPIRGFETSSQQTNGSELQCTVEPDPELPDATGMLSTGAWEPFWSPQRPCCLYKPHNATWGTLKFSAEVPLKQLRRAF